MHFRRYAIYYIPPEGPLADFGAAWLGWDIVNGRPVPHPNLPDLSVPVADLTETPRKYGLHATLKPPFRLAEGADLASLRAACADLARRERSVTLEGLDLTQLGGFQALTVQGNQTPLNAFAARVVRDLDRFRAPPTADELARRRKSNLTPRQDALLLKWGYPYVMEAFRFHITLTSRLPREKAAPVRDVLALHLAPLLPRPFVLSELALVGEDDAGLFHLVERFALQG